VHVERALARDRDEPVVADEHAAQQQIGVGRRRQQPARERNRLIRAVVEHEREHGRAVDRSLPKENHRPCPCPNSPRIFSDGELNDLIRQRVVQHAVRRDRHRRRFVGQRVVVQDGAGGGDAERKTDRGDQ
jgi:hypothetical protein